VIIAGDNTSSTPSSTAASHSPTSRWRDSTSLDATSEQERTWRSTACDYEQRFCGHCNTTTDIKEANFFGRLDKFRDFYCNIKSSIISRTTELQLIVIIFCRNLFYVPKILSYSDIIKFSEA